MKQYDLIIIGAGPAGLTSAIYAARYKLNVLVIGEVLGGYAGKAHAIQNFPSYEKISGAELITKMFNQVKKLGVTINPEEVIDVKKAKDIFEVITKRNKYPSKNIILATGSEKRKLNVEDEDKFIGKGLTYCATCDAAFYKNKNVAVVGGCDSALSSALLLSKFAKKVYLIHRGNTFCNTKSVNDKNILKNKKIETIFDTKITKLIGNNNLKEIELNNKKRLKIDGLFVEVGGVPSIVLAKKLGVKTSKGNIIVDKNQKTNVNGVFAAGDVTNNPLKQIITACGEGAIAANSVYKNVKE